MKTAPYKHLKWVKGFTYTSMQKEIFHTKNTIANDWYLFFCIVKMLQRNLYLASLL